MNNKPVAWMLKTEKGLSGIVWNEEDLEKEKQLFKEWEWDCKVVPLYTHPVKELTDEEIIAEAEKFGVIIADTGLKAIKAILRKAQEK